MSFSVPSSPAMTRSTKAQPVTPQRLPRHQPRAHSFYRSPLSPQTSPYTPMSSNLTTPDSIAIVRKRLAFTPEVVRSANSSADKSIADIAENWRNRASENGIKVSYAPQDDSGFGPDDSSDMSLSDVANESGILSTDEVMLEGPFMSSHRRLSSLPIIANRPRAQSHASLPSRVQPTSPIVSRNLNRVSHTPSPAQPQPRRSLVSNYSSSLMSTPPPNRALTRQLKMKGSMTDPPQPRRREALGNVPIPSPNVNQHSVSMNLEQDASMDLFDIDENDFEYEHDYDDSQIENSFSNSLQSLHSNSFGYPTFPSQQQHPFPQPNFCDPFHGVNRMPNGHMLHTISESVEHHFHSNRQQQPQKAYYDDSYQPGHAFYSTPMPPQFNQGMPQVYSNPQYVALPHAPLLPMPTSQPIRPAMERSYSNLSVNAAGPVTSATIPDVPPSDCSVCLAANPATLAILQPCRHPLCSTCLTSALNIVGEKDMECAVCKQSVADFKLIVGFSKAELNSARTPSGLNASVARDSGVFSSAPSSAQVFPPVTPPLENADLDSAFEFGLDFGELRASTPKVEQQLERSFGSGAAVKRESDDNAVLRIDNVPWDITPSQISRWLQQPVERVHVLLDPKGKTLSHAYVEVKNAAIAGAILRGEAVSNGSGRKERGSVLGRGRRARGVTVTRSGQQELMSDLFPQWRGGFDGSRPSLAGLPSERIISALEGGLLTESEVSGLTHLIREPDSHFLKVPSLPFHSLISLLNKFPSDVDSRVFWSAGVRDMLFEATCTALQLLHPRVKKAQEAVNKNPLDEEYTVELERELVKSGLGCKAFTAQQFSRLTDLAITLGIPQTEAVHAPSPKPLSVKSASAPRTPVAMDMDDSTVTGNGLSKTMAVDNAACNSIDDASVDTSVDSSVLVGGSAETSRTVNNSGEASLHELAKEFGVDAQVVHALAQRLAKLC